MPAPKWWKHFDELTIKFSSKEAQMIRDLSDYYKRGVNLLAKELIMSVIIEKHQQLKKNFNKILK